MAKTQGEFSSRAEAERAIKALEAAGVPEALVRLWNVIPEGAPSQPGGAAARTGALAGAILGGLPGLAAGGVLGGAIDAATAEGPGLPPPSGVRVVVDELPSGPDVAAILRDNGATNVG